MSRLFCLLLLCAAAPSLAITPQDLLDAGQLEARVVVDSEAPYLQRAPIIIAVEVATPRWFSRGTRIREFRIANAIVQPVSSFADNQTRTVDGESWSLQRWRFRVYALDAGQLTLPDIRVSVGVNTADAGNVEGEFVLSHPALKITTPKGAGSDTEWIASSRLTITESWEGLADSYLPGDAITRIRRFRVADAPAMMFPDTMTPEVSGLSLYAAPAVVTDQRDRGRLVGVREETLVVTIEKPGKFVLPGLSYRWYNTRTDAFELTTLEPFEFSVASTADSLSSADEAVTAKGGRFRGTWRTIAMGLGILTLLWLGRYPLGRLGKALTRKTFVRFTRLKDVWAFKLAAYQRNTPQVLSQLHQHMVAQTRGTSLLAALSHNEKHRRTLRLLLNEVYGASEADASEDSGDRPRRREVAALWNAVTQKHHHQTPPVLHMNPRATVAASRSH